MKKKNSEKNRQRTLTFAFAGFIMVALIAISILVGIIFSLLIYSGTIRFAIAEFHLGSFILLLLIWSAIIGAILAATTTRFLLSPINKINHALKSLTNGDFSVRLSFRGIFSNISAIREMTDNFNTMAAELEQTEMLRSDFINNFSHEFKTPIVSIAGFAKLLRRGNLTEEEQADYLSIIEEESLRLSRMATNVLDLTKVENQDILTNVRRINVSEQLRTCMLVLEDKWQKKNLEPVLPMVEYYINGNEELLKHVWINLLDNAIKFSPDYSTIEVSAEQKGEYLSVCIANYGEPIAEEDIPKIFNKFYQADTSHSTEGNGVGLAIVKKVVDLHQGSVAVRCRDGKTYFTVLLPSGLDLV